VAGKIQEAVPQIGPLRIEVKKDEEKSTYYVEARSHRNGLIRRTIIDTDLIESSAFAELCSISQKVRLLGQPPLEVLIDESKTSVTTFSDLVNLVITQGRKKLSIQRYKGLGEMNAEQLWDTTMNPEGRKLLQVNIEDAAEAEKIFSTLMGDQVEPRREFIETNALNVVNLDY
jgi:DNA gyrase subunit B